MFRRTTAALAAFAAISLSGAVQAQITIGATITATGTNASIGIPGKNAIEIMPSSIAGVPVKFVVLDDGGDPSQAVKNMRKLAQEDRADVVLGSSSTPTCLALADTAQETKTAHLCLAPISVRNPWVFFTPQPVPLMVEGLVEHMKANGVKSVGFIGFSDGWGDLNYESFVKLAGPAGIKVAAAERYARTDTSVTAQVLKMLAANPDAVFSGDAGTPAVLPHITLTERGFKGRIYHSHGVVVPDFIRVGGKGVEGAIAPSGPIVVADQLPDSNPLKAVAVDLIKRYDAAYGGGGRNAFVGYAWDSITLIQAAAPVALKRAKPGTPEFRQAMRDAIEGLKEVAGTHAVYNMSPTDHNGVDKRGRVLIQVENGQWRLLK